jgi:hypothetical protein
MMTMADELAQDQEQGLRVHLWVLPCNEISSEISDIDTVKKRSRTTYRLGDCIEIYFQTNADCYVTLLNLGTSGRLYVLLPNRYQPDHRVIGGRLYCFTDLQPQSTGARLYGEPGHEYFKAVASLQDSPLVSWNPGDIAGHDQWTETTLTLTVEP